MLSPLSLVSSHSLSIEQKAKNLIEFLQEKMDNPQFNEDFYELLLEIAQNPGLAAALAARWRRFL
jgi:hypothetical protein